MAAPAYAGGVPAVPDRVGQPGLRTPALEDKPAGPAAVALSAVHWGWSGGKDKVAVIGAAEDSYRLLDSGADRVAGMRSQLSPDGHYLAFGGGIADLTTGRIAKYAGLPGGSAGAQAWSPDGRYVAVTTYAPAPALFLYDRTAARATHVADLDPARHMDGWTVAFAPGGKSFAYQSGATITVAGLDGAERSHFGVPAADALAGKGAWSPDGSTLLIAEAAPCSCGKAYDVRWTLTPVDPATGAMAGAEMGFPGVYAVRSLGWTGEGLPVVAVYYPAAGAKAATMATYDEQTRLGTLAPIGTVRVLRVEKDATATTLLAAEKNGAQSIDVADQLLASGATRAGHPPEWHADQLRSAAITALIALVTAALASVAFYLVLKRRRAAPAPR